MFNACQSYIITMRETSPTMSLRSLDLPRRNFQQSFYRSGFAQSSVIGGRDRTRALSPTPSMISMGSNVSDAASIVSAINSKQFNKRELKNIKDACNKLYFKGRIRKKNTKKRYLKQCMKYARQKSSDDSDDVFTKKRRRQSVDSGELGSNSSCSSDDVTSVRTGISKQSSYSKHKSMKRPTQNGNNSDDSRSVRSGLAGQVQELRKNIQGSTMVKDSTNSLKHDSFRNILSLGPRSSCNQKNATLNAEVKQTTLKERFQSSCQLPSQRFPKSISVQPIAEEQPKSSVKNRKLFFRHNELNIYKSSTRPNFNAKNNEVNNEKDSDEENIFSEITDPKKSILKHPELHNKRNLNSSDESEPLYSQKKKTKLSSPRKVSQKEYQQAAVKNQTNQQNHDSDFVFAKPSGLPLRKSVNTKKTAVQLAYNVSADQKNNVTPITAQDASVTVDPDHTEVDEQSETIQSDVSSRPSFMKRKLFTQTLDVTEIKGQDTSPGISPQKVYRDVIKEKNKTRKLVTNQSCLTRNVHTEDNNLLDLIQKIVPFQNMSVNSNTTQKRDSNLHGDSNVNNNNNKVQEDKWDITAIISTCNKGDLIDTYTDEEIFTLDSKEKSGKTQKGRSPIAIKKSSVVVEPLNNVKSANPNGVKPNPRNSQKEMATPKKNEAITKSVVRQVHAFWNCDSDSEGPNTPTTIQPFTKKCQVTDNPISRKPAEEASDKSVMVKNIKSVLEITESSNESSMSIECVGNTVDKVASNRSLRLKTIKALRDKKVISAKPCKPKELQESLSNVLSKDKNIRKSQQKITSFFNSEMSTQRHQTKENMVYNIADHKENHKPTKEKQDQTAAKLQESKAQPDLNRSTRGRARTVTSVKNMLTNKSEDKIENKVDLNVSKRGRPRKKLSSTTTILNEGKDSNTTQKGDSNLHGDSNVINNNKVQEDKWDITAIISTCNKGDMSDTYTDEEIFTVHSKEKSGKTQKGRSPIAIKKCSVVVEPLNNVKSANPNGVKPNPRNSQKEMTTPKKNGTRILNEGKDADNNKCQIDGKPKPPTNKVSDSNKSQRERLRKLSTPFKINQVKAPAKADLKVKVKTPAKTDLNVSKRGRPRKVHNSLTPAKNSKAPVTNKNQKASPNKQKDEFSSPIAFRTRRSKEISILKSPVRNIPTRPVRNAKKSSNTTAANTSRRKNISNESNKENIIKTVFRKSPRRKNNSIYKCCDSPVKKTAKAKQKTDEKCVQPAVPARRLDDIPDSPTVTSFRPVAARRGRGAEEAGGGAPRLGVARQTVGRAPRHCAADHTLGAAAVDDDARSFRSTASNRSILSRAGRPKFLHVF